MRERSVFGGQTAVAARDDARLLGQLAAVRGLMFDGLWRTLAMISAGVGYPEASVSARLRDLRKARFGGYTVERRVVSRGLHTYRVVRPVVS